MTRFVSKVSFERLCKVGKNNAYSSHERFVRLLDKIHPWQTFEYVLFAYNNGEDFLQKNLVQFSVILILCHKIMITTYNKILHFGFNFDWKSTYLFECKVPFPRSGSLTKCTLYSKRYLKRVL